MLLHIRIDERHPTDDALDERVLRRELAEPARLVERLPRLHADHAVDAELLSILALQIVRQEIAAQHRHRIVDPAVLGRVIAPKMLMGVDLHDNLAAVLAPRSANRTEPTRTDNLSRAAPLLSRTPRTAAAPASTTAATFSWIRSACDVLSATATTPGTESPNWTHACIGEMPCASHSATKLFRHANSGRSASFSGLTTR